MTLTFKHIEDYNEVRLGNILSYIIAFVFVFMRRYPTTILMSYYIKIYDMRVK